MSFDWTINIGTVVQLIVLLGALGKAHASNRERLVKIETRLDYIEVDIKGKVRR